MADVFICRKGSLTPKSVRDLRHAGVCVVEAEDPASCTFMRASEVVSGNDMLWAAMKALQLNSGYENKGRAQREEFAALVFQLVEKSRPEPSADPRTGDE